MVLMRFFLEINQKKLLSFEMQKKVMKSPIYEDNEMQKTSLSGIIQIRMATIQIGINPLLTLKIPIRIIVI